MRKKILLSVTSMTLCLAMLTGCGTKLTANSLTLELGDSIPDDILEYVTISSGDSEKVLENATLSTEDIDNMAVGQYTATVTYKRQIVDVDVEVVDTVAPVLEAKDETFDLGDVITADDLVTIEDFDDVTCVLIDEDGDEQDSVIAEEGMTITVKATDASDNSAKLKVFPEISNISKLYGTWESTIDLSTFIEAGLDSDFNGFHEDLYIKWLIDFNEDGTFKMYTDEEVLTDSFNNYIESLAAFGAEVLYQKFSGNGYSRKQINSAFRQEYGMGIEEYILNEFQKSIDIEELVDAMETTGVYEVKGDRLYMNRFAVTSSSAYNLFSVDGDVLTIDSASDATSIDLFEDLGYPYEFNRIK